MVAGLVRRGAPERGQACAEPDLARHLWRGGGDLESLVQRLDRPALLAQREQRLGEPAGVDDGVVPVPGGQVVIQCRLPLGCGLLPLPEQEAHQPAPHGLLGQPRGRPAGGVELTGGGQGQDQLVDEGVVLVGQLVDAGLAKASPAPGAPRVGSSR